MLMAAMCAGAASAIYGSVWVGLMFGIAGSMAFALIHGVASITFRGNQLISGVALNFRGVGHDGADCAQPVQSGRAAHPALSGNARFNAIELPFADAIRDVPVIGPLYADVLSGNTFLVYVALLLVPVSWWVLYRTRFGLRLRAVGENPAAVDTAGISVVRHALYCRDDHRGVCAVWRARIWRTGLLAGFGARNDGGARVYRAGGADLCQVAALVCALGNVAVRLLSGPGAAG